MNDFLGAFSGLCVFILDYFVVVIQQWCDDIIYQNIAVAIICWILFFHFFLSFAWACILLLATLIATMPNSSWGPCVSI